MTIFVFGGATWKVGAAIVHADIRDVGITTLDSMLWDRWWRHGGTLRSIRLR